MDRLLGPLQQLAKRADPLAPYRALYRAKVLAQSDDLKRLDLKPEDLTLIPYLSGIPLRVGVPGVDVKIPPGHTVLVGWEGGRPDEPYATLWLAGEAGAVPLITTMLSDLIELGQKDATEGAYLGTTHAAEMISLTRQLETAFLAAANLCVGPLTPLRAGFETLRTVMQQHNLVMEQFDSFVSKRVKLV